MASSRRWSAREPGVNRWAQVALSAGACGACSSGGERPGVTCGDGGFEIRILGPCDHAALHYGGSCQELTQSNATAYVEVYGRITGPPGTVCTLSLVQGGVTTDSQTTEFVVPPPPSQCPNQVTVNPVVLHCDPNLPPH